MTGACVRDCTVLAAAGLLASTRKSYNRAKSESALLVLMRVSACKAAYGGYM